MSTTLAMSLKLILISSSIQNFAIQEKHKVFGEIDFWNSTVEMQKQSSMIHFIVLN